MYKEFINKKNFFIVNYGLYVIVIVSLLIVLSLHFIKIGECSILKNVFNYYVNKDKN